MAEIKYERCVLRIIEINEQTIAVIIPGWNPDTRVWVLRSMIPVDLLEGATIGDHLIANVTLGAYTAAALKFKDFERAPEPADI